MNIIYLNRGKYELDGKKIIVFIDTTFAVVKTKPEKKKKKKNSDFFQALFSQLSKVVSVTAMIFL